MIQKIGLLKYQLMMVCYKKLFFQLYSFPFLFIFSDPDEDQFAKRSAAKKERVAKNEFQRLKNIARGKKINGK